MDTETGLYYFSARYYDPKHSIFLSVDPMADKYPSMSPYMYCAGNQIIYVDPDGRDIKKSVATSYTLGAPKTIHDLGQTNYTRNDYSLKYNDKKKEFDITINFQTQYSKYFKQQGNLPSVTFFIKVLVFRQNLNKFASKKVSSNTFGKENV